MTTSVGVPIQKQSSSLSACHAMPNSDPTPSHDALSICCFVIHASFPYAQNEDKPSRVDVCECVGWISGCVCVY